MAPTPVVTIIQLISLTNASIQHPLSRDRDNRVEDLIRCWALTSTGSGTSLTFKVLPMVLQGGELVLRVVHADEEVIFHDP